MKKRMNKKIDVVVYQIPQVLLEKLPRKFINFLLKYLYFFSNDIYFSNIMIPSNFNIAI